LHLVGGEFVEYLKRNVVAWVYLTERNADVLRQRGLSSSAFTQAFNSLSDEDVEWVDRKSFRSSHGLADNDFACVLCSRAIEEKGWGTAIEVCRRLNASQGRKVHLFLIGDGPVYQERSTRFGHLPNVHFLGHVEEPIRLFRAFDAGVFPTIFSGESFPMFILECFRAGLPVVSTDVGDIRRMLTTDGGFAGAVIPGDLRGGDQADAFVRRLTALRDDPFEYERARSCARLADRRYTAKNLGDLYENLFLAGAPQVVRRRQA
jgi:glycosyltransferase involved in cell wall biosynthesis